MPFYQPILIQGKVWPVPTGPSIRACMTCSPPSPAIPTTPSPLPIGCSYLKVCLLRLSHIVNLQSWLPSFAQILTVYLWPGPSACGRVVIYLFLFLCGGGLSTVQKSSIGKAWFFYTKLEYMMKIGSIQRGLSNSGINRGGGGLSMILGVNDKGGYLLLIL
jgi:hypothetical protein